VFCVHNVFFPPLLAGMMANGGHRWHGDAARSVRGSLAHEWSANITLLLALYSAPKGIRRFFLLEKKQKFGGTVTDIPKSIHVIQFNTI